MAQISPSPQHVAPTKGRRLLSLAFIFILPKEEAEPTGVLMIGIGKSLHSRVLKLSRNKRYTLTPEKLKWDKFKLTYK